MTEKKLLTKSEFQVMNVLWNLPNKSAFTGEILAEYADPKPAYTTLATFLKILNKKGFVKSTKVGNMLYFTPVQSKEEYALVHMQHTLANLFDGDVNKLKDFINEKLA